MTIHRLILGVFSIAVLALISLLGCATVSESRIEPSPQDSPYQYLDPEETEAETLIEESEDGENRIIIRSNPSKATVYVNRFYRGETPFTIEDPEQGAYSITLEKDGHRSSQVWLRYDGAGTLEYERTLQKLTGFVGLEYSPWTAEASIDGEPVSPGLIEMPVGRYSLEVRDFGYETEVRTFEVGADDTTHIRIDLEEADLRIEDLRIRPRVFNPKDPGALGSTDISFWISTYGYGSIEIRDDDGERVFLREVGPFLEWDQAVRWNGRDGEGGPLPDGTYDAEVTVFSPQGEIEDTAEEKIVLDRSTRTRFRSAFSGISGLVFSPVPEVLPPLRTTLSLGVLAHLGQETGRWYSRVPAQLALRISPVKNLETLVQITVIPQGEETTPFSAGLSVKYLFIRTDHLALAVSLKGTYLANDRLDTLTNFTGGGLSLNFSAGIGPFRFVLSPELQISPYRVVYESGAVYPDGFYIWAYGRFGFLFDFDALSLGLSSVFRFKPFSEGFQIHWPAAAGIELHWVIPDSRMGIFGTVSGEYSPLRGVSLLAGLGIGVVL